MRKVVSFDSFAHVCPFFTSDTNVNNGYGCTHSEQEETDIDQESGKEHGKCYCWSCPLGIEPDEEDLDNIEVDWDGITREDCIDENGEFLQNGDFLMVNRDADASEDEKTALKSYERYINRYKQEREAQ